MQIYLFVTSNPCYVVDIMVDSFFPVRPPPTRIAWTLILRNMVQKYGNVNSVDWSDQVERWNGLLEWATGVPRPQRTTWMVQPSNDAVTRCRLLCLS